jgi:hypothetical protein
MNISNIDNEALFEKVYVETSFSIKLEFISDNLTVSCCASVFYNGILNRVFCGETCEDASRLACAYIESRGGTCPISL